MAPARRRPRIAGRGAPVGRSSNRPPVPSSVALVILAPLRCHGAMSHAVRPIRVLAADDVTLAHMRAALAGCADLDLTPADSLPDVAALAPGHDGPPAIRAILPRSPATNVVVLASDVDREDI